MALVIAYQEHLRLHMKGEAGMGKERVLGFLVSQDTFFIKPLLSRPGSITDPSNTKEETETLTKSGGTGIGFKEDCRINHQKEGK